MRSLLEGWCGHFFTGLESLCRRMTDVISLDLGVILTLNFGTVLFVIDFLFQ